jgi:hypothetical protein
MLLLRPSFGFLLLIVVAFPASGQTAKKQDSADNPAADPPRHSAETSKGAASVEDEPETWVHLADGRRIQVAEVTESSDGLWFKVGNVTTFVDRQRVVRVERTSNKKPDAATEPLRGSGNWKISDAARVENFFLSKFGRRLPSSTIGQSDLHTRWGYDHRNGMDVGLHPDSVEGRGLIEFLRSEEIPFQAFRGAVPGVSTGPHIHVGNPSRRLSAR